MNASGDATPRSAVPELPPPMAVQSELEPSYGIWFWAGVVLGWAAIAFGVASALSHRGATRPSSLAAWVIGLALLHDLVFAPLVLGAAWILRRTLPRPVRGIAMGAVMISGLIVLFSVPSVRRWGAQPDNPSFLPRDVGVGVLEVIAIVWLVAAIMFAVRLRRAGRAG